MMTCTFPTRSLLFHVFQLSLNITLNTALAIKDDSRKCEFLMNAKQMFKYELTSEWKSRLTSFMFTAHKPNMRHLFNMPFISGVSMSKALLNLF